MDKDMDYEEANDTDDDDDDYEGFVVFYRSG